MLDPIHPFPGRMAPEIAFDFLQDIPRNSVVLDPMCGSGVALRSAVVNGHKAIGNDADPLAVLMSKVWIEASPHKNLTAYADDLIARARKRSRFDPPWQDAPTGQFVKFWFAPRQRRDLARLSMSIHRSSKMPDYIKRAMQIALSRIIVTKTRGASLAWDVSHSRPHKKKTENDFDVLEEFRKSCETLAKKLGDNDLSWAAAVRRGDARSLSIPDQSVDAVITSPPYMNAIDYMRGHRLSLVWLGYSLDTLRVVRAQSIGTELTRVARAEREKPKRGQLDGTTQRLMDQYIYDLGLLMREIKRVSKPKAQICIITANSNLRGYEVPTNKLVQAAAAGAGIKLASEMVRHIPKSKRYLPVKTRNSALKSRMMEEHIQNFVA